MVKGSTSGPTLMDSRTKCLDAYTCDFIGGGQLLCVPRALDGSSRGIEEESEIKPKSSVRTIEFALQCFLVPALKSRSPFEATPRSSSVTVLK